MPTYCRSVLRNVVIPILPKLVPNWFQENEFVASGDFPNGPVYLCIRGWPADAHEQLVPLFQHLMRAARRNKPIIIDVRANSGGSEAKAIRFAACFAVQPVHYALHFERRNGRLSGPHERWLMPQHVIAPYRGRVAVLIGKGTISSCESFVLMMKQLPNCTLIGENTAGASGNPQPLDLGNGVWVYIPSWMSFSPHGTLLEGRGVSPDISVAWRPSAFSTYDPVLEKALNVLSLKQRGKLTKAAIRKKAFLTT